MHKKRALQVAVAGILSLGITVMQQANAVPAFPKIIPPGTLPSLENEEPIGPLVYAYEQFKDDVILPSTSLAYPFRLVYRLPNVVSSLSSDFYVTFTLSEGNQWSTDLQQPDKFKLLQDNGAPIPVAIARAGGGSPGESTVTYLVAASKQSITPKDIMDFNFQIKTDKPLSAEGGQIQLSIQVNLAQSSVFTAGKLIDAPQALVLATSASSLAIDLPFDPDESGTGFISVEENSLKFSGTGAKDSGLRIDYGEIDIGSGAFYLDSKATAPQNKGGLVWRPDEKFERGTLIIKDGNFNASGLAADGNVYIEINATTKIIATSIDLKERSATWDLKAADLKAIFGAKRPIYLVVTGTTAIDEFRQLETIGTIQVKMDSRNSFIQNSTKLRHLIKNGTVCTLYNIPDSTALDRLNIRLTNDSSTTGFVKGRLRGMDGKDIYVEGTGPYLELISSSGTDALGPNQTKRLTIDEISKLGAYKWTGRAVLTLESNIPDGKLQVFGLLRAANAPAGLSESPLLNMSTGATGNSCD